MRSTKSYGDLTPDQITSYLENRGWIQNETGEQFIAWFHQWSFSDTILMAPKTLDIPDYALHVKTLVEGLAKFHKESSDTVYFDMTLREQGKSVQDITPSQTARYLNSTGWEIQETNQNYDGSKYQVWDHEDNDIVTSGIFLPLDPQNDQYATEIWRVLHDLSVFEERTPLSIYQDITSGCKSGTCNTAIGCAAMRGLKSGVVGCAEDSAATGPWKLSKDEPPPYTGELIIGVFDGKTNPIVTMWYASAGWLVPNNLSNWRSTRDPIAWAMIWEPPVETKVTHEDSKS